MTEFEAQLRLFLDLTAAHERAELLRLETNDPVFAALQEALEHRLKAEAQRLASLTRDVPGFNGSGLSLEESQRLADLRRKYPLDDDDAKVAPR